MAFEIMKTTFLTRFFTFLVKLAVFYPKRFLPFFFRRNPELEFHEVVQKNEADVFNQIMLESEV